MKSMKKVRIRYFHHRIPESKYESLKLLKGKRSKFPKGSAMSNYRNSGQLLQRFDQELMVMRLEQSMPILPCF